MKKHGCSGHFQCTPGGSKAETARKLFLPTAVYSLKWTYVGEIRKKQKTKQKHWLSAEMSWELDQHYPSVCSSHVYIRRFLTRISKSLCHYVLIAWYLDRKYLMNLTEAFATININDFMFFPLFFGGHHFALDRNNLWTLLLCLMTTKRWNSILSPFMVFQKLTAPLTCPAFKMSTSQYFTHCTAVHDTFCSSPKQTWSQRPNIIQTQ